jgi:uncharacterized protein (DUF488 family)
LPRYETLPLPIAPRDVQLENRLVWNESRSLETADFYTLGYSGRTIQELIDVLERGRVATLVDIRHSPVSMYRPDFSKGNLARHLRDVGIQYLHLPDLGIPRDIRSKVIGRHDRRELWDWYDQNVVESFAGFNLHYFFNFADHPITLMCVETDPTCCHRHRLVLALERLGLRGFDL